MKIFFPAGTIKHAHVYVPHTFDKETNPTFMVCPDAEYLKGFIEFDEFFAKTKHAQNKAAIKISSRKRPPVDTTNFDVLLLKHDICRVSNKPSDSIFLEHDCIVELEMEPIPKNEFGFSGFMLILKSVTVNF